MCCPDLSWLSLTYLEHTHILLPLLKLSWVLYPFFEVFCKINCCKMKQPPQKNPDLKGTPYISYLLTYRKRCSVSLVIREMWSKTTVEYHFMPDRIAIIKKVRNNKCWEGLEKKEPLCPVGTASQCGRHGRQNGGSSKDHQGPSWWDPLTEIHMQVILCTCAYVYTYSIETHRSWSYM